MILIVMGVSDESGKVGKLILAGEYSGVEVGASVGAGSGTSRLVGG